MGAYSANNYLDKLNVPKPFAAAIVCSCLYYESSKIVIHIFCLLIERNLICILLFLLKSLTPEYMNSSKIRYLSHLNLVLGHFFQMIYF